MDDDLWKRSRLGHAVEATRGPAQRRSRTNARAHVGRRLRRWRLDNDLSQEQGPRPARLVGTASRMHLLAHGEIPSTRDDVATVAKVLEKDAAELVHEALAAGDPEAR